MNRILALVVVLVVLAVSLGLEPRVGAGLSLRLVGEPYSEDDGACIPLYTMGSGL